jgi:hypothetical protein
LAVMYLSHCCPVKLCVINKKGGKYASL